MAECEIRVGPGHQARLPDYRPGILAAAAAASAGATDGNTVNGGVGNVELPDDPELNRTREEIKWVPAQTLDGDLLMFLRAARSMAAFAGMCDGGSPDDGCVAASKDDTTINALDTLHASGYDPGKALQALVKCPVPKGIDKKWSDEEVKRFVKGLRQFGKNFFRIRKDLLPHKDTPELVEFYYLWKKTPGANNNRPHRRNRRQGSLRRIRSSTNNAAAGGGSSGGGAGGGGGSRSSPATTRGQGGSGGGATGGGGSGKDDKDASSPLEKDAGGARPLSGLKEGAEGGAGGGASSGGSDDENNSDDDSDSRDSLRCQHCFASGSRDLQQYGKDRQLLCGDCRSHHKKHGELPPVPIGKSSGDSSYVFRPVQSESPDSSPGRMRTRGKTKEQNTPGGQHRSRPKRGNGTSTPDSEMDKKPPKSPAIHGSPSDCKKKSKETPTKNARKRNQNEMDSEQLQQRSDDKDTPHSKKKKSDNVVDAINDESNDIYEEKVKEEKLDEKMDAFENDGGEKKVALVEPMSKQTSEESSPSGMMVDPVDLKEEETEEKSPKEEDVDDSDKVITIDPKTGLIGADLSSRGLVNVPLKMVVDEIKIPDLFVSQQLHPQPSHTPPLVSQNQHTSLPSNVMQNHPTLNIPSSSAVQNLSSPSPTSATQQLPQQQNAYHPVLQSSQATSLQATHGVPVPATPPIKGMGLIIPQINFLSSQSKNAAPIVVKTPKPYLSDTSLTIKVNLGWEVEPREDELKDKSDVEDKPSNFSISKLHEEDKDDSGENSEKSRDSSSKDEASPNSEPLLLTPNTLNHSGSTGSANNVPPNLPPNLPLPLGKEGVTPPGMAPPPAAGILMPPHLALPPHMAHFGYHPFAPPSRAPYIVPAEQPQNLKIKQEIPSAPESFDPLQNLKDLKVPGQMDNTNRLAGPTVDNIKKELGGEAKVASSSQSISRKDHQLSSPIELTANSSSTGSSHTPEVKAASPVEESHTPPLPSRPRSSLPSTSPVVTSSSGSASPFVAMPASSLLSPTSNTTTQSIPPPRPSSSSSKPRESSSMSQHHTQPPPHISPSHQLPPHLIQPSPTSIPGPVMHPSQQPSPLNRISPAHHPPAFLPPHLPPHHPLVQHTLPLFAAAAMHNPYAHPYSAYPFPYPYPYPIPPPQLKETTMTHHSSSSVTTRVRETERMDEATGESGSTETTTLHHSSVHHSHSSSDKQQGIHISHSTTSSSTASVKKQSSTARVSSPVAHMSATMSQTQSTSISLAGNNHHHSHHHSHHHQSGDVVLNSGSSPGRSKPSHHSMMAIPAIHPMSSMGLPPPTIPGSSLEALRAHAVAAANMQQPPHVVGDSDSTGASGPSSSTTSLRHPLNEDVVKTESTQDADTGPEEDVGSPQHVPRGPSPEPKIEDSECHRSQSAIFLRHWNRGDFNSCTRTDLTFKPVPDSKLARKREERLRKQAERDREEREKVAQQAQSRKVANTPESKESTPKPPSRGPIETISSPYDRFAQRAGYPDTPALRQLSEYARPHAGFSPGRGALGLPQCIDSMLQYQFNSMYGPRDSSPFRMELEHLEREKREREMRELRERELNDRLKEELMKSAGAPPGARMATPLDPHWLELHRRYAGGPPPPPQFGLYPSPGHPGGPPTLSQLDRDRLERLGIPAAPSGPPGGPGGPGAPGAPPHPHPSSVAALEAAERLALATDPMVRLQMAGISPEYHAHTHAHTHAHSHTHLHLHPSQQAQAQQEAAAAAAGFPLPGPAGYPRGPNLLPPGPSPRELASLGLHHPAAAAELLARPYADQLAHQAAAHEQLQRQMLLEREAAGRAAAFPPPPGPPHGHGGAPQGPPPPHAGAPPPPHPSLVAAAAAAQHDEFLRAAQRERELKVRALEEAARGARS